MLSVKVPEIKEIKERPLASLLCPLWARSNGALAKLEGRKSKMLSYLFIPEPLDW